MTAYRDGQAPPQDEAARLRRLACDAMDLHAGFVSRLIEDKAAAGRMFMWLFLKEPLSSRGFNHSEELRDGVAARMRSKGLRWVRWKKVQR